MRPQTSEVRMKGRKWPRKLWEKFLPEGGGVGGARTSGHLVIPINPGDKKRESEYNE
jgi:hypothetical protein